MIRRFGRWTTSEGTVSVAQPGLILAWPFPIDRVVRLPVKQEIAIDLDASWPQATDSSASALVNTRPRQAITGDHNLVELNAMVRYRIDQPERYAASVQNPMLTISHVVQTAIGSTVSSWSIDETLRLQRPMIRWDGEIVDQIREQQGDRFDPALWLVRSTEAWSESEFEELLRRHLRDARESAVISEILAQIRQSQSLSEAVLLMAQARLQLLDIGVRLTALEFRAMQPPEEVRESFLAVHDARVEQEAWRQAALGEQSESIIDAEILAQQTIADAKGKLVSRVAQGQGEAVLFAADLRAFRGELGGDALRRLRYEAWEQILAQKARVFAVSEDLSVGALHLSIPEGEKPR